MNNKKYNSNAKSIYHDLEIKITYFENRYASDRKEVKEKAAKQGREVAITEHINETWGDFVKNVLDKNKWRYFTAHNIDGHEKAKENFDAVVFAEMVKGASRSHINVINHYAIALDIDDGATMEFVRTDLKDYEYLIYSSGGQGLKKGERFRVILPLKRPISADAYNVLSESLRKRFWYSDSSFSKSLQIQYLPIYNKKFKNNFVAFHNEGELFDFEGIEYVPVNSHKIQSNVENIKYVPIKSQDTIFNVNFINTEPADGNIRRILDAIIEHNRGSMEYEDRRILANRLLDFGVDYVEMVKVLNAVGRPGARHTGSDMANMANASYGHAIGLRKNFDLTHVMWTRL